MIDIDSTLKKNDYLDSDSQIKIRAPEYATLNTFICETSADIFFCLSLVSY